jgi:hypothetical protein
MTCWYFFEKEPASLIAVRDEIADLKRSVRKWLSIQLQDLTRDGSHSLWSL